MDKVNRRTTLKLMGMGAALLMASGRVRAQGTPTADQVIQGKDPRLIVHNSRTGVLETPLELLREHERTPKEILFIRNNQVLPQGKTLEPIAPDGWIISIEGMVENAQAFDAKILKDLPQVEVEMVLQCSGNGRSFFARAQRASGTQWKHGGMGNVVFKGVPFKVLVEHLKLNIYPGAKYVTVNGKDQPPTLQAPDFEHSVPLEEALEKGILALEMNGEPLPAAHGGPVRFVMPGFYGTMNVKWVDRIRFDVAETFNHNQIPRYRVPNHPIQPGSEFNFTFENSRPNWHQKVKSVIFAPLDGEEVKAGNVLVRGVAWNDGLVPIEAVLVSTDQGRTWIRAKLTSPQSPYAWFHWETYVALSRGAREIWVQAVDKLGRAQPLDGTVHWNPRGYEWNGVDIVKVKVV